MEKKRMLIITSIFLFPLKSIAKKINKSGLGEKKKKGLIANIFIKLFFTHATMFLPQD